MATQQAQPLTERVDALIKHYSRPTGTSKDCSCTEAAETVAVLDALRLTLERLQEPTDKVTDAFYQAWIQHGDKKSAMAQLRIAIKAAAKAADE